MQKKILPVGFMATVLLGAIAVNAAEKSISDLIQALGTGSAQARVNAIDALAERGDDAAEAVDALAGILSDKSPTLRAHAARALGKIGAAAKPAGPALVATVADADEAVRRAAVHALMQIRPGPKVTLPLLAKALRDEDPTVRLRVLNALANIGDEAVPLLVAALEDKETEYWACIVVSEIGPEAEEAVPALVKLLDSPKPEMQREAMIALAKIGAASAPAVPKLVKALDGPQELRPAATYALGMIGQPAKNAAQKKLEANTKSSNKFLAEVSIWALAKLDPNDKDLMRRAAATLAKGLIDKDPHVRMASARGIAELRPGPAIMIPALEKVLDQTDDASVDLALDALASLGPEAVPQLVKALEHPSARAHVAYILGRIGPEAKPALGALVDMLDDEDPNVRRETRFAIASMGPEAKAAVPALIKMLSTGTPEDRYGAVFALGSIGPDAMDAKATLQKMLDHDDEFLALTAAWALARIHPECPVSSLKTVPLLAKGLSSPEAKVRLEAAESLRCLGPLAKPAVDALKKALKDDDDEVREMAAQALEATQK